jgi:hypothetical protein
MNITVPTGIQKGDPITAAFLSDICRAIKAITPQSSADILVSTTSGGTTFRQTYRPGSNSQDTVLLGKVQTDVTSSGTTVSVKACDAAGTESGSAFNVYLKPDQSAFDPTAVTVANTAATATCKLAAGAIIGYAYSGSDAYMLGAIAQVCKDWWIDGTSGKVVYAVYWRIGQAVSTVSNVEGPDTQESDYVPCS